MAVNDFPSEKEFLINIAVKLFNKQYGKNVDASRCYIQSIEPNYQRQLGYEITTSRPDDYVRLRIYFDIVGIDSFRPYRLEVDEKFRVGYTGDEVFVSLGTINPFYRDEGIYTFRWISRDPESDEELVMMSGHFIGLMSGGRLKEAG